MPPSILAPLDQRPSEDPLEGPDWIDAVQCSLIKSPILDDGSLDVGVNIPDPVDHVDTSEFLVPILPGPRLSSVRAALMPYAMNMKWEMDDPDLLYLITSITNHFTTWMNETEYIIIKSPDGKTCMVKCSKRGNDVYRRRVFNKFIPYYNLFKEVGDVMDISKSYDRSNLMYVTGTYNSGYIFGKMWTNIGKHFNRFMYRIRAKYGKVSCVRCWESQEKGKPHFHAILLFHDHRHNYGYFRHPEDNKPRWILRYPKEKREIANLWGMGTVDVRGISDPSKALNYLMPYIMGQKKGWAKKEVDGVDLPSDHEPVYKYYKETAYQSLALNWFFGLRQYSVSAFDSIVPCITKIKYIQVDLSGNEVPLKKWTLMGVVSVIHPHLPHDKGPPRYVDLSTRPDLRRSVYACMRKPQIKSESTLEDQTPDDSPVPGNTLDLSSLRSADHFDLTESVETIYMESKIMDSTFIGQHIGRVACRTTHWMRITVQPRSPCCDQGSKSDPVYLIRNYQGARCRACGTVYKCEISTTKDRLRYVLYEIDKKQSGGI